MKEKQDQQLKQIIGKELDQLEKFSSPMQILKKAFSSFLVVLLIGAGFVVNAILSLLFAFKNFGLVPSWYYLVVLVLFLAIFPAIYIFFAMSYAKSVVIWEAYREMIRPMIAKLFGKSLDVYLVDNPENAPPVDEKSIVAEIESRQKNILEKLPDFLRAYVQIFFSAKDVITIIRAQRASGGEKEEVKRKAMDSLFESIDLQISELAEPSLIPFWIVAAINLVAAYFLL
ncbi:MAG: hypothetical protein ACRBFS_05895 [Aureispira sp.]